MTEPPEDDHDDIDPEQAERDITAFVESAEPLEGPPVADLADAVAAVMRTAWDEIGRLMSGVANDKLLATMLLVGQRARQATPDDPEQWRLHGASSLLSGLVGERTGGR